MDMVFFGSVVVGVRTVSCLCRVVSPAEKGSWFCFWFTHPEPSVTSSFSANAAIVLPANCFETHGCRNGANTYKKCHTGGVRVARQKENIKRNYLWKKNAERERENRFF